MRIDAFAHIIPPRYFQRLEGLLSQSDVSRRIIGYRPWLYEDPALVNLDARWRTMDVFDDYMQVLTLAVPPIEELGDIALARELARQANEELAELVSAHPDRFAGFVAALPRNDVEATVKEIEHAIGELGALGIQLHTNVAGAPLDERRFDPIFETVTRLAGAIWIHPTRSSVWSDYPSEERSKYGIWWSLGWPYETSVCMARLVYSGHFDRYPDLRIITHHAGAMIPHFSARLASPIEDDDREAIVSALRRPPIEYFREFYIDTALFGATHGLRCAVEFFGTEHVLFGTDTPLGGPRVIQDTVTDVERLGLSDEDTRRVFADNAHRVLGVRR